MKYKVLKNIWVFGDGWTKPNVDFQEFRDVYFLEKYDELSESVAFAKKMRYFTDQNGPRGKHVKMNFEYFQIQKSMLQKKLDEKMGSSSSHVLFLSYGP